MKKYLFIYAVVATVVIVFGGKYLLSERERLECNNRALMTDVNTFRTAAGESAAEVQVLRLRVGEYEELRAADAAKIRDMGVKIRRLESAARSVTATTVEVKVLVRDTIIVRDTISRVDTVRLFRWRDSWVSVEGEIYRDSVSCDVRSIDTLQQIVYRVPRKFLFFRFGTKAIKQQIISTNPHTEVRYTEYIKVEK
ncbi:MAG: hypothetical protein IJX65_03960 [Alistipes sp.]|nr:hypothetical protein [Alistipes sp.]